MATIGADFPQSRQARKAKLEEILEEQKPISSVKVPGRGKRSVYRIPLSFLSYNPHNTRFIAEAKTVEKRLGCELSDENPEHVREIERFIWSGKRHDKNESTINSLIKDGQLQPGVVTIDGIVLSGNRRFRLLNEISRNKDRYSKSNGNTDGLEYFEAAIIEEELTKAEIVRYESYYQYGTDEKVDYDPIQKYIAAHDQKEIGFSNQDIANNFLVLTEGKEREVKKWLEIYELMEEYLGEIGEPGVYTALEAQEQSFLNLRSDLKGLQNGRSGTWAYDEFDIADFKRVYFDYIRNATSTHDFRIFKKVFEDEARWRQFCQSVQTVVDENVVPSFEDYRRNNDDLDEAEVSKKRRKDYQDTVGSDLDKLYGKENAKVTADRIQELPLDILKSIQQKLAKLEVDMEHDVEKESYDSDDFLSAVRDILSRVGKIKQKVD